MNDLDFRKFKYSNYIDYIVYYVGMKYNMKNLESETISAKEIIDFYNDRTELLDISIIAQSNLSTTLKYLKDKKILIDAGFVNRQKRYYFNFQSNFLNMDFYSLPDAIFEFSRELTAFVFLSHIKKIDRDLFPQDPEVIEFLMNKNEYLPFYNFNSLIQRFRKNIHNSNYCKHLIKKVNGQKWFTKHDYNNLRILSEQENELTKIREKSFTDTLG